MAQNLLKTCPICSQETKVILYWSNGVLYIQLESCLKQHLQIASNFLSPTPKPAIIKPETTTTE